MDRLLRLSFAVENYLFATVARVLIAECFLLQLFSSGLVQQDSLDVGIMGFLPDDLKKELRRCKKIVSCFSFPLWHIQAALLHIFCLLTHLLYER